MQKYNKNRYKVKTLKGFKDFDGIRVSHKDEIYYIKTDDYELSCSPCHKLSNGEAFEEVKNLKAGDSVLTEKGLQLISHISSKKDTLPVYDLLDVKEGNVFLTNGILSHNCEFLGTGDTFIDRDTLKRLNATVDEDYSVRRYGSLRIWKHPDPYSEYILAVDASFGRERDFSAFHVIDLYNGEQVAEFYSNKTSLSEFAKVIHEVGTTYNLAHVVIERNGLGIPLIQDLFETHEYENLWMDDKQEFGFQMTSKAREKVLSSLEEALRGSTFKVNSKRTVDELNTFIVTENGKIEADKSYHDDLVMSLALAAEVWDSLSAGLPMIPDKSDKESQTKEKTMHTMWVSNNSETEEDTSWLLK